MLKNKKINPSTSFPRGRKIYHFSIFFYFSTQGFYWGTGYMGTLYLVQTKIVESQKEGKYST